MAVLVGKAVVGAPGDVHTEALNKPMTRVFDNDQNEYIYLQGVASCAIGTWVSFDENGVTTRAVANAKGRIAVATAAVDATTEYGWFQIYGEATGLALTLFADNAAVYLTSTAGSIDDADVAGDAVIGAIGRSAVNETTLLATFELNYPYVGDIAID